MKGRYDMAFSLSRHGEHIHRLDGRCQGQSQSQSKSKSNSKSFVILWGLDNRSDRSHQYRIASNLDMI